MVINFHEIKRFSEYYSAQIVASVDRTKQFLGGYFASVSNLIMGRIISEEIKASAKILLVANTGWNLYNFRLPLARFLRLQGVEVVLVSPKDAYVEKLQSEGFRWIELRLSRYSINPLVELWAIGHLIGIYFHEKPFAVHHFTVKCVLYGTVAAMFTGTRAVINAITGLGYIFNSTDRKAQILKPMIIFLFRQVLTEARVRVVFQNQDDLKVFANLKLIVPHRAVLIRSSGIDVKRFSPSSSNTNTSATPVILLASRLITEKGVLEYVEAARILKNRGVCAKFWIVGAPDPGNSSSISQNTLDHWRKEEIVDLLGHVEQIEKLIAPSTVVVLPSHGEGVPRILLEAAAMGKPLVATDVPGCRDVIEHGKNGFLVPVKDAAQLANAIEVLLENPELCQTMGTVGRKKVLREFDVQEVIRKTVEVYELMGVRNLTQVPVTVTHRS